MGGTHGGVDHPSRGSHHLRCVVHNMRECIPPLEGIQGGVHAPFPLLFYTLTCNTL